MATSEDDHGIVDLRNFARTDFTTPALVQALTYWEQKRTDRACPLYTDIDPIDLPAMLPYLIVIDVVRDASQATVCDFRFRLVGSEVSRLCGRSFEVDRLSHLEPDGREARLFREYAIAVASERPRYHRDTFIKDGGRRIEYEQLVMPLMNMSDTITVLFGGFIPLIK